MQRIFTVLGASAVLALVVSGSMAYQRHHDASAKLTQALINPQANNSASAPPAPVDAPAEGNLVSLIDISDPFDRENNTPRTSFITADDGKFSTIASVTAYSVVTNEYQLPSDFTDVGTEFTTFTSNQPVMIIQKLTFGSDSVITWKTGDDDKTFSWESHPDRIFVKQGETYVVTYTSKDGGVNWTGAVVKDASS